MEKISKTGTSYADIVDENNIDDAQMVLLKNIVDKINEIIDWINTQ